MAAAQPQPLPSFEVTASKLIDDSGMGTFLNRKVTREFNGARTLDYDISSSLSVRFALVLLPGGAYRLFCTSSVGDMAAAQLGLDTICDDYKRAKIIRAKQMDADVAAMFSDSDDNDDDN